MEFVERFSKTNIEYINSLTYENICCYLNSNNTTQDNKTNYKKIKNFCASHIKANYEIKRLYVPSKGSIRNEGRLFAGDSIQGLQKNIRGFICKGETTDVDMENAHPKILSYLCKINHVKCANLDYYINNRDKILAEFDDRDYSKKLFLASVNNDKLNRKEKNKFFKDFDKETKLIQKNLLNMEHYRHFLTEVPTTKKYNFQGSAINKLLCYYENKILQKMVSVFVSKNIEICSLMFDGLLFYGDYYDNNDLLLDLEKVINTEFTGLDMTLTYKKHSDLIEIPKNWNGENSLEASLKDDPKSFNNMLIKFEKIHAKIINRSNFIKFDENTNEFLFFNKKSLIESYEHIKTKRVITDKDGMQNIKESCFIKEWLNYENIRYFDDLDIYPPPLVCPKNIFNLWTGFSMDKIDNFINNQEAINLFLDHIKILCGNDDKTYQYIIKWIGQMIQFPAIKTTCPIFISNEGAGKGSLMLLFAKMLGDTKVFETTSPSKHVWGNFNGSMKDTFLVNLNELNKKEFDGSQDYFKALVTDNSILINIKNVKQMKIKSFHRFIITTNNEEPIPTKKGDRRNVIIRSSDELIGNKEYFSKLYKLLDDIDAVKSVYEYFKTIPDLDDFHKEITPITEYQQELQEMYINPIEIWCKNYIKQNCNNNILTVKTSELYENFDCYLKQYYPTFKYNNISFSIRFKRLNINGIIHSRKNSGSVVEFDIDKCLEFYELDKHTCMVDLESEW
tara:strand:+ start:116 stop:2314 length:2199 start_codon:yes stop_codon:yes gene_type:complete